MELVQIIYNILILGTALLLIVVGVSYLLSKSKKGRVGNPANKVPSTAIPRRNPIVFNQEQISYRKGAGYPGAAVYQMDSRVNKDLKILRKPTVTKTDLQEIRPTRRTNGNGKRYTIVNEEMKKTFKPNVINF